MSTLLDKQIRYLGATRLTFWVRPELVDFCQHARRPAPEDPDQGQRAARRRAGPARQRAERCTSASSSTPAGECAVVDDGTRSARPTCKRPGPEHGRRACTAATAGSICSTCRAWKAQSRLAESLSDLISWNEESLIEDALQLLKGVRKPDRRRAVLHA